MKSSKPSKKDKLFKKNFYEKTILKDCHCHYCGVCETKARAFFKKHPKWTRGGKRGFKLEVDRIDSNKPYSKKNCVLACYVCNNTKSNFDLKFFKPIVKGIRNAWKKAGCIK